MLAVVKRENSQLSENVQHGPQPLTGTVRLPPRPRLDSAPDQNQQICENSRTKFEF